MDREVRQSFDMPMSCSAIKRKVAAWEEIYGEKPRMELSGDFYTADGEIAFSLCHNVTKIGRDYLTLTIDGRPDQIDPLRRVECCRHPIIRFITWRDR